MHCLNTGLSQCILGKVNLGFDLSKITEYSIQINWVFIYILKWSWQLSWGKAKAQNTSQPSKTDSFNGQTKVWRISWWIKDALDDVLVLACQEGVLFRPAAAALALLLLTLLLLAFPRCFACWRFIFHSDWPATSQLKCSNLLSRHEASIDRKPCVKKSRQWSKWTAKTLKSTIVWSPTCRITPHTWRPK